MSKLLKQDKAVLINFSFMYGTITYVGIDNDLPFK